MTGSILFSHQHLRALCALISASEERITLNLCPTSLNTLLDFFICISSEFTSIVAAVVFAELSLFLTLKGVSDRSSAEVNNISISGGDDIYRVRIRRSSHQ